MGFFIYLIIESFLGLLCYCRSSIISCRCYIIFEVDEVLWWVGICSNCYFLVMFIFFIFRVEFNGDFVGSIWSDWFLWLVWNSIIIVVFSIVKD